MSTLSAWAWACGVSGAAIAAVAGLHDGFERAAFVGGVALHGFDEVRDEVEPALELHVDLRPGVVDLVPAPDQTVVHPDEHGNDHQDDHDDDEDAPHGGVSLRGRTGAPRMRRVDERAGECGGRRGDDLSATVVSDGSSRRSRGSDRRVGPWRSPRRVRAGGPERPCDRRVAEHPLERRGEQRRIAAVRRARRRYRRWRRCGTRRARWPPRSRPAAIASMSTTPNDSPPSDGAQNTSHARRRRNFSASEMRPSQTIEGFGRGGP